MASWQSIGGFFKKRSRSRTLWIGGSIGFFGVIAMIVLLTGISTQYTGDIVCGDECVVYVNITSTYWRICFAEDFELVQTIPKVEITTYVPARGKGNWRLFDSSKDCIERKNKYRTLPNRFKIVAKGNGELIKWSVDKFDIDPVMISWKPIYENLSKEVNVYDEILIKVPKVYSSKNDTWSKETNYTRKEFSHKITEYYNGRRIGIKVGGVVHPYSNVYNNTLYKCKFYMGDRNWKEYPKRQYEIDKGVCEEIKLI